MRIPDKVYDVLKWLAIYVIPALSTFVGVTGLALQWDHTAVATTIIGALGAFLAACIGMSVAGYEEEKKEKYQGNKAEKNAEE